mgnify:FL=1
MTPPPVKVVAEKHGIPVAQPESFADFTMPRMDSYDFFIVAAYAKILPRSIIEIPRLGTIGVHPSLLPKFRGASPIQGTLLNGETETGVTLYLMDEKVDHGPILATKHWPLATNDTYEIVLQKLAGVAGDLLAETIPKFLAGEIVPQEQHHAEATFTKKFKN